jgi:ATP-dependent Clp protease ATP-binding subunit ClpB
VWIQVLDDGRLTDAKGRTVRFDNTVIIMTSNLGAQHLLEAAAAGGGAEANALARGKVMAQVRAYFRPELLNRLDDIIVFEPLSEAMLRNVARMAAARISERLAKKGVQLEWDDSALALAARESFDPAFGARPLRRWMERHVVTDLSYKVVAAEVSDGCLVRVSACDGALRYAVTRIAPVPGPAKRTKLSSASLDDLIGKPAIDTTDDEDESAMDFA